MHEAAAINNFLKPNKMNTSDEMMSCDQGREDRTVNVERRKSYVQSLIDGDMEIKKTLPEYRSHKTVRAAEISTVYVYRQLSTDKLVTWTWHNVLKLNVVEQNGAVYGQYIHVSDDYMERHKPEAGGYYILYEDGYESYSPAKAFKNGYTYASK